MESQQIERWLSARRFEPFLDACKGDHTSALALYGWHAAISAACFEMIHHFEVLVRNAIDGVLGMDQPQEPLKDTWLMDFNVLQPDGMKQVIVAVERLEKGKGISRSRVVSGFHSAFGQAFSASTTRRSGAISSVTHFPTAQLCAKTSSSPCVRSNGSEIGSPITTACSSRTSPDGRTRCSLSPGGSILTRKSGSRHTHGSMTYWPGSRNRWIVVESAS